MADPFAEPVETVVAAKQVDGDWNPNRGPVTRPVPWREELRHLAVESYRWTARQALSEQEIS